jgi:hypothetical protein
MKSQGPTFFIVGAPRCGTTALYTYLSQHPDVFLPELKEPYFFATDLCFSPLRPKTEAEYISLFSRRNTEKIAGEGSTHYIYSKEAPLNIKSFCPSARIIIMLRNPVDMIYSWHSLMCWQGHECIADFSEALDAEPDRKMGRRLSTAFPISKEFLCYRELGKYPQYVQRYLETFGADSVHIIDFHSLARDAASVVRDTCRFLGVSPDVAMRFPVINENKRARSAGLAVFLHNPSGVLRKMARAIIPDKVRHRLIDKVHEWNTVTAPRPSLKTKLRDTLSAEFSRDVVDLERMLGRSFRHWGV